ncbi:MAG: capsular biosynthesis protein [Firmicutes bacterium]|nr:capsular biosynthesis protein [Bacillota bacterium]
MVDLHSHIAWDVDDGFPNLYDSREALARAREDGIRGIVSTPHFVPGQMDQELYDTITMRQRELLYEAKKVRIVIYPGAEMFMNEYFAKALHEGWYRTINNTKYLLVEYDVRRDIHDIDYREDTLFEVEIHDMVPVIAHVERYFHNGIDKKIIQEWFDKGYVFQVNRTSILGEHGKQMQKNALWLLDNGYVHVVASDAHRLSGVRTEKLSDVKTFLENRYGKETAELLLLNNPIKILENKKVENMEVKKRGLFSWLR